MGGITVQAMTPHATGDYYPPPFLLLFSVDISIAQYFDRARPDTKHESKIYQLLRFSTGHRPNNHKMIDDLARFARTKVLVVGIDLKIEVVAYSKR